MSSVKKCEHGRGISRCKECKGGHICEHNKQRTQCKECNGSSFCEHGKRRSRCVLCHGSEMCEHDKRKATCSVCGVGKALCEHGKQKYQCPDCNGSQICKSRKEPYNTGCKSRGNRKLNGFCSHCFVNLFPEDPRALTVRKKSIKRNTGCVTYPFKIP